MDETPLSPPTVITHGALYNTERDCVFQSMDIGWCLTEKSVKSDVRM